MRSIIPDDAVVDTSDWYKFEDFFPVPLDKTSEKE